jgi:glycosyltransferase involved in cell wall biosynthesis
VLAQTYANVELIISDNASTDGTQEICRRFAREDPRVVYHRQATNVGLLNNFVSAAEQAAGTYLRWIGDDDSLEPDYVARVLDVFADDPRRVLVTTQIVYGEGVETIETGYDAAPMGSADPVERFTHMLRMLTTDTAIVDPLYAMIRRDVATMPRKNMMREDQIFAARLALAGPWGHVAAPLASRGREEDTALDVARLLGVPPWRRHVRVLVQCRELVHWIEKSSLDPAQRRRARAEVLRFYARGKSSTARRRLAKLERVAGRPARLSPNGAR